MSTRAFPLETNSPAATVVWVMFWVHLIAQPIYALLPVSLVLPGTFLIVFSFAVFSFAHSWVTRGARATLTLFGLCVLLAGGLEALSVATGFPFGRYVYNPVFGPAIAGVSVLVPVCWFMMGYPALRLAEWLSPRSAVLVAALALAAWDLFLDPQMVRAGLWTWLEPGFYAGVPWVNYFGWVLTALLIFAAFRAFSVRRSDSRSFGSAFDVLPVMAYLWTWFGSFVVNLFWWGQPLVAVVGLVGMGAFAVPAALKLARSWQGSGIGSRG